MVSKTRHGPASWPTGTMKKGLKAVGYSGSLNCEAGVSFPWEYVWILWFSNVV